MNRVGLHLFTPFRYYYLHCRWFSIPPNFLHKFFENLVASKGWERIKEIFFAFGTLFRTSGTKYCLLLCIFVWNSPFFFAFYNALSSNFELTLYRKYRALESSFWTWDRVVRSSEFCIKLLGFFFLFPR